MRIRFGMDAFPIRDQKIRATLKEHIVQTKAAHSQIATTNPVKVSAAVYSTAFALVISPGLFRDNEGKAHTAHTQQLGKIVPACAHFCLL